MRATLPKTDALAWLGGLQACHLKRLAFLTGLKSTGTKKDVHCLLKESLVQPRLPRLNAKVLSIDMGVKNLAFCLLDVRQGEWNVEKSPALQILEWKRMDLSTRLSKLSHESHHAPAATNEGFSTSRTKTVSLDGQPSPVDQTNMYSPTQLSKVAYMLASEFVKYKPDVILIERQRFRSGGGAAILEWTVRVNMLESMLWACLETMRHEHVRTPKEIFPDVIEMSPRRIGSYWLAQHRRAPMAGADIPARLLDSHSKSDSRELAKSKRSLEKKDKIALASFWLRHGGERLGFHAAVKNLVSVFRALDDPSTSTSPKKRKRKNAKGSTLESSSSGDEQDAGVAVKPGKLDDLADCLVQGVTFALWEENRRRVLSHGASLEPTH